MKFKKGTKLLCKAVTLCILHQVWGGAMRGSTSPIGFKGIDFTWGLALSTPDPALREEEVQFAKRIKADMASLAAPELYANFAMAGEGGANPAEVDFSRLKSCDSNSGRCLWLLP